MAGEERNDGPGIRSKTIRLATGKYGSAQATKDLINRELDSIDPEQLAQVRSAELALVM